ncbi:MAG: rane protein, partial [Clostridia bacterium]|nr:rane protein [Clostridia bacterium]
MVKKEEDDLVEDTVKIKKYNPNFKLVMIIATTVFFAELVYGIYLGYVKGILLNDAFSRTANAFYVVFVKPSRYASIGLVWNPLPSTLQIPFMALARYWRPIASSGISGTITTAAFAALGVGILLNTFLNLKISRKYAVLIVLLYALNPFIFFYGSNGMSETFSFFFIICSVSALTLWMERGTSRYMIQLGFALVGLFYTRYEALPFAA